MSKKKLLTSITAVVLAATMVLGGTFAWQSINQSVVNEGSDVVNPGGRLHDDFDGESGNKNVYVENFATQEIYTRIRLEEYFKVAVNMGHGNREETDVVGSATTTDDVTTFDYRVFTGYDRQDKDENGLITTVSACLGSESDDEDAAEISYFQWTMGSAASDEDDPAYYMPTFNKNKDSLVADINGSYKLDPGEISSKDSDQYEEMYKYTENEAKSDTEIYDADENTYDEVGDKFNELEAYVTAGNIMVKENVDHFAKKIPTTTGLISMTDWLAMVEENGSYDDDIHGNYWVYDSDGWVYWSAAIAGGSATGRLLDSIEMTQTMDDGWYYGLNVVAQFITAGDMGQNDGTGFYDTTSGEVPSSDALKLLEYIGVDTTGAENIIVLRQVNDGGVSTVALDDEDGDDTAAEEESALPSITVEEGTTVTFLLEKENNWLTRYSADEEGTSSAAYQFNFDRFVGSNITTEDRVTLGTDYEEYQFGDLAKLCLDYAKNKMTAKMAGSAVIAVAGEDGRVWSGEVTVKAPEDVFTVTSDNATSSNTVPLAVTRSNYAWHTSYTGDNIQFQFELIAPSSRNVSWSVGGNPDYTYEAATEIVTDINIMDSDGTKLAALNTMSGTLYLEKDVMLEDLTITATDSSGSYEIVVDRLWYNELWSEKVTMRMPTLTEYKALCTATDGEEDIMHWTKVLTATSTEHDSSSHEYGGYDSAQSNRDVNDTNTGAYQCFRPAFEATEVSDCADLKVGDIVVIGTLYKTDYNSINTTAVKVPTNTDATDVDNGDIEIGCGDALTLGATLEDEAYWMRGVYVGDGVFVCNCPMTRGNSWKTLAKALGMTT